MQARRSAEGYTTARSETILVACNEPLREPGRFLFICQWLGPGGRRPISDSVTGRVSTVELDRDRSMVNGAIIDVPCTYRTHLQRCGP